jgi:hypothetical protein
VNIPDGQFVDDDGFLVTAVAVFSMDLNVVKCRRREKKGR